MSLLTPGDNRLMHNQYPVSKFVRFLGLIIVVTSTFATAQSRPQLTMEWALGEAGSNIARVMRAVWLDDNTAVLYNDQLPQSERTFERLDPASGKRQPLVDASKALASLKSLQPSETSTDGLDWPEEFNRSGTKAVYIFGGDIYLLDLPTSTFTRITSTSEEEKDAHFSPDGTKLAFVRDNDLYVYDLADKKEKRLTKDGSTTLLNGTLTWVYWEEIFGRQDIGYWWSPDSKSIAYLQTDVTGVPVSTFVDFRPQDPRIIHQVYPKAGEQNPKVRVGVVGVESPQSQWITIPQPFEWLLRVTWLPDSQRLAIETLDRPQTTAWLYFSDVHTGASKHILTETDPGFINDNDDLYFLRDGQHFLWASERDGYMHLYRYKMDGTLVNKVTNGDWAMATSATMFWVRRAVTGIDEKNGWVYFTTLKGISTERQLYRVNLDGTGLTQISHEHGTHRIAMSPDARYYFDDFSDIKTLPGLSLHSSDGKRMFVLAAPRPELLPAVVHFPELLTIPTSDGFPMPAQILKPSNFDPHKKYPVILHIYGGPSAPTVSNSWQHDMLFYNILAENGYVVAAIDNRAATAISKTLENTLVKNPAVSETADLVDGVKWLKKQPWVDPNRVGVYGWSGGGTNTLNLMTRSQEFKAGIAGAPVTDWHYYDSKWAEALVKSPQTHPELYDQTSLVKRADQLHGTLLIIYGTYDDNVHPQNEEAFENALIEAGKQYENVIYPMRKHGFVDTPAKIHLGYEMLNFWKHSL
jgi:dipeptidyl-peptidase-4